MTDEPRTPYLSFFATCAAGTELALKDELRELRFHKVRADRGGVRFEGHLPEGFRACLSSRIAMRILLPVGTFSAPDGEALYDGVRALPWERWLSPRHTLAVSSVTKGSALTHTQFIAQKTKDAIVDRLRDLEGARPDVARHDPDVSVFVHLAKDHASVHLDLAGEPLHRRGWRTDIHEAPLKETLAAAMVRLSGWDRVRPLVDPMCGSGTIAIEADLWARGVAPGLARERFGFERWASHGATERAALEALKERLRAEERSDGPDVLGCDLDRNVVATATANARRAASRARFRTAALRTLEWPTGLVISNPPYGVRIAQGSYFDELAEAAPRLGDSDLALLLESPPPPGLLAAPERLHPLWNGPLECRLACWDAPFQKPRPAAGRGRPPRRSA